MNHTSTESSEHDLYVFEEITKMEEVCAKLLR